MNQLSIQQAIGANVYPGRGILFGKSADGMYAAMAYFITGRSENSRNRIIVEEGQG
ncbi:MAG TPA: inosine monophosphate cyclohydrolase, partial [Ruminococcaceae bacterium]|nr:inosine monophosphate cyclohydrolase [Oscillospiraceae bacterium]